MGETPENLLVSRIYLIEITQKVIFVKTEK